MIIFFNFSPTSNHLHPLQDENCDSNSRLVVDEDDNGKFRLESVNMIIFFNFSPTSNHLHPLQDENCDSNSRLVVDEDDNGKFRLESVKPLNKSI